MLYPDLQLNHGTKVHAAKTFHTHAKWYMYPGWPPLWSVWHSLYVFKMVFPIDHSVSKNKLKGSVKELNISIFLFSTHHSMVFYFQCSV